jgi:tetratricopeptide (TPR) repeat protein
MNNDIDLDADELKYLAIQASRNSETEHALMYLKHAIRQRPADGELLYLLAAEHAQLGMYDRAAEEMTAALECNPEMHTARLQLGLLHLTAGRIDAARSMLQRLAGLGAESYFSYFATGLECLIQDQFPACRAALERGISINDENPALNGDMQKIIDALPLTNQPETSDASSVWLSGYERNSDAH